MIQIGNDTIYFFKIDSPYLKDLQFSNISVNDLEISDQDLEDIEKPLEEINTSWILFTIISNSNGYQISLSEIYRKKFFEFKNKIYSQYILKIDHPNYPFALSYHDYCLSENYPMYNIDNLINSLYQKYKSPENVNETEFKIFYIFMKQYLEKNHKIKQIKGVNISP